MYKIGAVVILVIAAFFFGRSTGKDNIQVKCQAKEIKEAQKVNNVQQEVIKNRPLNSNSLINRLRQRAEAKRSD